MNNCDQILSGRVAIGKSTGRRHQIGGSQDNGMNHKKNGKTSNGGSAVNTVSLSINPFARILHIRSFLYVSRTGDGEVRKHTSSYAQNAWHRRIFFSCTRDHRTCVGSRPNGQGHEDCLSPRAHQQSLIRLMCRGTLHESQFSSPDPFSSFCSTPPPAQTSLLFTGMSVNTCVSLQGGLLFGRMAEQSPLILLLGAIATFPRCCAMYCKN